MGFWNKIFGSKKQEFEQKTTGRLLRNRNHGSLRENHSPQKENRTNQLE